MKTGLSTRMQKVKPQVSLKKKIFFFREKIDENKGNPRGIWKALKSLSGTYKPRVRINEIVTENGIVSDEAFIANELNNTIKYMQYFIQEIETKVTKYLSKGDI